MFRKIEEYLKSWKEDTGRKPMILRGARQVGKTYTVDKFAKENYKHYLKLNIEKDSQLLAIFDTNNIRQIIDDLTSLYQIPLLDNESLIFIDEIQLIPKAITTLRYFYEDRPDIHIIAAGSLLDQTLNEIKYSMPVGRVEFAYLYPLSFKEFLMAQKEEGLLKAIENYKIGEKFSQVIHSKISEHLRMYFFVGGMPEAVDTYIKTQSLIKVEGVHSNILTSIQHDFAKYGTHKQQEYLKDVLHYCVNNIGQKVKYSNVNKNAHSNLLKDAFIKLEWSRIIHLVRLTKSSQVPITQYQNNDVFKPIFMDIGMVCHLADIKLTDIRNLASDFEGSLAEQFVGQEFVASASFYRENKLNYWQRDSKNANAEIDYLYQIKNLIFPIEVKAGKRGTLKSLHVFLAEKNKRKGIRLNLDLPSLGENLQASVNLKNKKSLEYDLLSLPMYFASELNSLKI